MAKKEHIKTEQHVLKSLEIVKLKGVRDLSISFEGNPVTGIFGLNGCGKTTILQAIVSLYRDFKREGQHKELENTKMSRFFKQTDATNKWAGSKYIATFSYFDMQKKTTCENIKKTYYRRQIGNKNVTEEESKKYEWTPRQARKLQREVCYIPLSLCLPDIEKIKSPKVTYKVEYKELKEAEKIAESLSYIFNKKYSSLELAETERVQCFRIIKDNVQCHSFSLGAGEQRVERILRRLYRANKYSLVVIDELDLTIHTAALKRLVDVISKIAQKNKLQVIFTSHRQELMSVEGINVRYIHNLGDKTVCINKPSPLLYDELTGGNEKVLHLYVEDQLASEIVKHVLQENNVLKNSEIHMFGAIESCCSLAVGLVCQDPNATKTQLVCHDGDNEEYVSQLTKHMNYALTGDDEQCNNLRTNAMSMIMHFNAASNGILLQPEKYICESILEKSKADYDDYYKEIYDGLEKNRYLDDHHNIIKNLTEQGIALSMIINMFAYNKNRWGKYTADVRKWIENAITDNKLTPLS